MDKLGPTVLDVWREVGSHLDIGEFAAKTFETLAAAGPVRRIVVRRLLPDLRSIETVAEAPAEHAAPSARESLAPNARRRLVAWLRRGAIAHAGLRAPARGELALLAPGFDVPLIAVPLGRDETTWGALILAAGPGETFAPRHLALAAALAEPFTAALANDRRLRELTALREAAEADRRSLLTRLGRDALVDEVVGAETGLAHVMERVAMVAPQAVPVLILGDTGTGKELVARTIHMRSPRLGGPFHRVNCGAIPPELVDSELFGHERGAFTGAVGQRRGWFERADGGTLFLDEVGELPAAAQVRLLTVVQDGWLERVGGHEPIRVDVRIIAATNRDLTAMVRQGRFREDLWYRLAVFTILLPPLRERREDIPALAAHFARRAATRFGLTLRLPDPSDLAALSAYGWPGNIRELATVIDRAAILGDGKRLDVTAALGATPAGLSAEPAALPRDDASPGPGVAVSTLDDAMRRHIERALAATLGRVEGRHGAAALLGINPHTLRGRMRKLGVPWARFRRPGAGPA